MGILVVCTIIILTAVFFLFEAFNFQVTNPRDVGPGFMPKIYSISLLILGVVLFIKEFRLWLTNKNNNKQMNNNKKAITAMIILFTYLIVTPFLGLYIATFILTFVFLWITDMRNIIALVSIPLGLNLFIYFLFYRLLGIQIPLGYFF